MKSLHSLLVLVCGLSLAGSLQGQVAPGVFGITKITKTLITSPQFTYSGAQGYQPYQANQPNQWLEVEVEFSSTPEYVEELTLRYHVLVNGKVLTGEVTHTNVAAGKGHRSVMYVPPQALSRFMGNRQPIQPAAIQNIAVQIVQQGAVKDDTSLVKAPAQWYAALPRTAGLLLNKNETPFAALYWDRYEMIKPASH